MDKQIEQEIINVLDEQVELKNTEAFAGNVVKEEFHKGAIFGIKIISNILAISQQAVEPGKIVFTPSQPGYRGRK